MSKSLHVTVSDWVFEELVEKRPKNKTRSEHVETLIIKGSKSII